MADAAPKPSSSVKLVLLGEAAVGKVSTSYVFLHTLSDRELVITCYALREQRLSREQGTHHRRYVEPNHRTHVSLCDGFSDVF